MCRINCNPDIRELTLKHGIEYPSDIELVMMILGSGTKGIPVEKLSGQVVKTLARTNRESMIANLLQIKGMGAGKALAVAQKRPPEDTKGRNSFYPELFHAEPGAFPVRHLKRRTRNSADQGRKRRNDKPDDCASSGSFFRGAYGKRCRHNRSAQPSFR